jgi:hypothetical protein
MRTRRTDGEAFDIILKLEDGEYIVVPDVVETFTPPELYPDVLALVGHDVDLRPTEPEKFWFDCAAVPADTASISAIIDAHGYCDVEMPTGETVLAIAYLPADTGGVDDNLVLEDGTLAAERFWKRTYRPNPTVVGRLVHGYGIK